MQDSVLVVIDMQKGFLNAESEHIIPSVVTLVHECERLAIPIIFTRFLNTEGSPFKTLMGWKRLSEKPETDLADELIDLAQLVIDKSFYSSFTDQFRKLVAEYDWKTIILCGVATESCVTKTAADAFELGLRPIVVSDACASDAGDEFHQAGLKILCRFIGKDQITTSTDLIEYLLNRTETSRSRSQ